jgi:hypothetical protein
MLLNKVLPKIFYLYKEKKKRWIYEITTAIEIIGAKDTVTANSVGDKKN